MSEVLSRRNQTKMILKDIFSKGKTKTLEKVAETEKSNAESELPYTKIRIILAMFGAIPCEFKKPYFPSLDTKRSSFLYSVLLFSFLYCNLAWTVFKLKKENDELAPAEYMPRVIRLGIFSFSMMNVLGIVSWLDVRQVRTTVELFLKLQANFRKATGKPMKHRRERFEWIITVFAVIGLPVFDVVLQCWVPHFRLNFSSQVAVAYGNWLAITTGFYWIGLCINLSDAADDMKVELLRVMENGKVTPSTVYDYRTTWLCMRQLLDCLALLYGLPVTYSISLASAVGMLYLSAKMFILGEVEASAGGILASSFYLLAISCPCLASHLVQVKMKFLVSEVLPKITLASYDIETQREILMLFMIENSRPAVAKFQGLRVVNKTSISSLFSNCLSWIIVIAQLDH